MPPSQTEQTPRSRRIRIQPSRGWSAFKFRELWEYRDLFFILALRDVKVRYKQTALGVIWVILQPLIPALIFALIFGRLAKLPSEGMPYILLVFSGMLPWNVFSGSLQRAGGSIVGQAHLITKVYFPRMIIPFASTAAVLMDFCVSLVIMFILALYYRTPLTANLLFLPAALLLTLMIAVGISLWLSALSVYYRDFIYTLPFLTQVWLYVSPVAYSSSLIPKKWMALYSFNPMVGAIEGFRWALIGKGVFPWVSVSLSAAMGMIFFISGALVFRRIERSFADVI